MAKICFPHYDKGDFASLAEALNYYSHPARSISNYILSNIVQYNTCYRDYLRQYGVEKLILQLTEEAPLLKEKTEMIRYLREWVAEEKLADYDIQCYNIEDKITILGHTFNGLNDIQKHIEYYGSKRDYENMFCWDSSSAEPYDDIHIGQLDADYPSFDSSDSCDHRSYKNYIFSQKPITKSDMLEAFSVPHGINFSLVHENIPEEKLPLLYYVGDGQYMLLATK